MKSLLAIFFYVLVMPSYAQEFGELTIVLVNGDLADLSGFQISQDGVVLGKTNDSGTFYPAGIITGKITVSHPLCLTSSEKVKTKQGEKSWCLVQLNPTAEDSLLKMEEARITAPCHPPELSEFDAAAEFPGGLTALQRYLSLHLRYPQDALEQKITGKVFVSFIVDNQGKISCAKVTRGLSPSADREALRLVTGFPSFKPATLNGTPVASTYHLPINFSLHQ